MELDINSIVETEQKKLKLNMNKPIASGIVANTIKAPWYIRILPSFIPVPHRDYKAAKITQPQLEKILKASKEKVEAAKITQPQLERILKAAKEKQEAAKINQPQLAKMFEAKRKREIAAASKSNREKIVQKNLNPLMGYVAYVALAGLITFAFYEQVIKIDDKEHQPYVNEANAYPKDLHWAKKTMIEKYQELRKNDTKASVYNLLSTSKEMAISEAEKEYPSNDFFHPKYNPHAPLSESTKVFLIFEDLGCLSKVLDQKEFESILSVYPQMNEPVLTLSDPIEKVKAAANKYKFAATNRELDIEKIKSEKSR